MIFDRRSGLFLVTCAHRWGQAPLVLDSATDSVIPTSMICAEDSNMAYYQDWQGAAVINKNTNKVYECTGNESWKYFPKCFGPDLPRNISAKYMGSDPAEIFRNISGPFKYFGAYLKLAAMRKSRIVRMPRITKRG